MEWRSLAFSRGKRKSLASIFYGPILIFKLDILFNFFKGLDKLRAAFRREDEFKQGDSAVQDCEKRQIFTGFEQKAEHAHILCGNFQEEPVASLRVIDFFTRIQGSGQV